MSIRSGNKFVQKLYVGSKPVRAIYAGRVKVWPNDTVERYELRVPSWEWYVGNNKTEPESEYAWGESDGTLTIEGRLLELGDEMRIVFPKIERVAISESGAVITTEIINARDLSLTLYDSINRNLDIAIYAGNGSEIFIGLRKDEYDAQAQFDGVITISDNLSEAQIIIYLYLEL